MYIKNFSRCAYSNGMKTRTIFRVFNNFSGIQELKQRVEEEGCECIACESTGVYWYRLYLAFEGQIRVIVGNAYQIKSIPGRKTDVRDAQWIAELAMNGLINPSRVFPKNDRELRELTRSRESTVHSRTQIKNRIHRILDSAGIALGKGVNDIFGKSGIHLHVGTPEQRKMPRILSRQFHQHA